MKTPPKAKTPAKAAATAARMRKAGMPEAMIKKAVSKAKKA